MLPSERLTLTLWPLIFSHETSITVLDVESGDLAAREMCLSKKTATSWQLAVNRPTHSTEQRYRFSPDGRFLGMQETMPLLWLRELVPAGAG